MNVVAIVGRLVRDPDLRSTSSGTPVANVSIAVNRSKDEVIFVDVTIWDKQAEAFCKFHHKGDLAAINGRLTMDEWDDKQTGARRTKLKVTCESWSFAANRQPEGKPF